MICHCSSFFDKALSSNENSIVWAIQEKPRNASLVSLRNKLLANNEKLAKGKLCCHLDIAVHLENIELKIRNKSWRV